LRQDLDRVFAAVRKIIRAKEEELAERGKELKGAASKVKTYLPRHLIQSWILALKRGERLRQQAKYRYGAGIVQEKLGKRVQVPALSVPLVEGELERLGEITVKLDRLVKQLKPQLMVLAQARLNAATRNGDDSGNEYEAAGLGDFAEILQVIGNGDDYDPDLESTANQNWSDQEAKERQFDDPISDVEVEETQADE
jgi:hypothetical protein